MKILAEAARRMPDPRSPLLVTHSAERILTQQVYQILAGYPDGNDAQLLRDDPLFKTIAGIDPREKISLPSGSTINRFQHAFTRREADKPLEERDVIFEVRKAQIERINALNEFLVDVFVRTRKEQPTSIIIDLDPTDDPTHGQQQLSLFHGYFQQHQYFPMMIFEGHTGMPLGSWLRPGTVHASCGAVDMLKEIVDRLKAHWPDIEISVRGDGGLASPEMYDYCEAEKLQYAFGYSSNKRLERLDDEAELKENARLLWWMTGQKPFQLFHSFEDYAADSSPEPRRVVTKVEVTKTGGSNIRYVVTNMSGHSRDVYHGFYTQRGNVPERPIGELKNGFSIRSSTPRQTFSDTSMLNLETRGQHENMDRLSSHRFLANSHKLMVHTLAYLLCQLYTTCC